MGILVSDFDSTLTQRDFFDLVRERWPVPPEQDPWKKYVAGELTHFEALAEIFRGIRSDETSLLKLVDTMELDLDLASSVATLKTYGWDVVVASAGCDWYIRYLLRQAGVSIPVHANPGTFDPSKGLLMTPPVDSPFFSASTGIDKPGVVRDALRRTEHVAFAGDGRPDLEPALLVHPKYRFARGWLADALTERGETFHSFSHWSEIVTQLLTVPC